MCSCCEINSESIILSLVLNCCDITQYYSSSYVYKSSSVLLLSGGVFGIYMCTGLHQ